MAEEIELEKCNFQNFRSPMTLTLDRVIRHMCISHRPLSTYQISLKLEKLCRWTYGWTDGRTYWRMDISPSNVIRSTMPWQICYSQLIWPARVYVTTTTINYSLWHRDTTKYSVFQKHSVEKVAEKLSQNKPILNNVRYTESQGNFISSYKSTISQ